MNERKAFASNAAGRSRSRCPAWLGDRALRREGRRGHRPLKVTATLAFVALLSACVAGHSQERRDPAEVFASADTNGDGVVTRAEFLSARAASFGKYDRNGDGFIDENDVPQRLRSRQKVGDRLDALIDRFDTDHDKRISRAEFVDGPALLFDRADTNHDGQLTQAEIASLSSRSGR